MSSVGPATGPYAVRVVYRSLDQGEMILQVLALVIAMSHYCEPSYYHCALYDSDCEPFIPSNKFEFDMYDIYADEVRDLLLLRPCVTRLVHRDLASNQGSKSRKNSCAKKIVRELNTIHITAVILYFSAKKKFIMFFITNMEL